MFHSVSLASFAPAMRRQNVRFGATVRIDPSAQAAFRRFYGQELSGEELQKALDAAIAAENKKYTASVLKDYTVVITGSTIGTDVLLWEANAYSPSPDVEKAVMNGEYNKRSTQPASPTLYLSFEECVAQFVNGMNTALCAVAGRIRYGTTS